MKPKSPLMVRQTTASLIHLLARSALVLIIPYFVSPASANHCFGSKPPCPIIYPGPHPATDRGYMWACDWPDKVHYRCHTVRLAECICDPKSDDFRDRDNFRNAQNLVEAWQKCVDQNGSATLVKNISNTALLEWVGVECELDSGTKWFESHPTADICYDRANSNTSDGMKVEVVLRR
jgi:hypothetical protein